MENKTIVLKNGQKTSYFDLVALCFESKAAQGVTIGQMRENFKMIDLFITDQDSIELTPAQLKTVKDTLDGMIWGVMDKQIVEMQDYINDL